MDRLVEPLGQVARSGIDACPASTGAPLVLSRLRNAAITLRDQGGACNKAVALGRHAAHLEEALAWSRAVRDEN